MSDTLRSRATPAKKGPPGELDRLWAGITGEPLDHPRRLGLSDFLAQRLEALLCIRDRPRVAMRQTVATLTNPTNGARGTSVAAMHAHARSRKAKRAMGAMFARALSGQLGARFGLRFAVVLLTRVSPRTLDSDGLEAAFKSVRDGIAAGLGIDDASPLVRFVCNQEQGKPREHLVRAELFIEPRTP